MKPMAIDLYCGLGGFTEGLLAEGYEVVGFDIERHQYLQKCSVCDGTGNFYRNDEDGDFLECDCWIDELDYGKVLQKYPAQLVLQDVLTLHGSQFRNAALIVASPPCQEFSYMAMPWKLAKAKAAAIRADKSGLMLANLTRLFDACFRIQREACEAAERYIPMVVENVKGAQPWVGRAKANFGSFYLWGDVAMVGNRVVCGREFGNFTKPLRASKNGGGGSWFAIEHGERTGEGTYGSKPVRGEGKADNERRWDAYCNLLYAETDGWVN